MFIKRKGERAGTPKEKIAYAKDGHKAFNEKLEARRNPEPKPLNVDGPWMSSDVLRKVPDLRRAFDFNRDPLIREQILDLDKTEAQRRGEQSGRSSVMVGKDKPKFSMTPPREMRRPADRRDFQQRWMAEQRDAAFSRAVKAPEHTDLPRAPAHKPKMPSQ